MHLQVHLNGRAKDNDAVTRVQWQIGQRARQNCVPFVIFLCRIVENLQRKISINWSRQCILSKGRRNTSHRKHRREEMIHDCKAERRKRARLGQLIDRNCKVRLCLSQSILFNISQRYPEMKMINKAGSKRFNQSMRTRTDEVDGADVAGRIVEA